MMNREAEFGYQAACRAGATLPLDARGRKGILVLTQFFFRISLTKTFANGYHLPLIRMKVGFSRSELPLPRLGSERAWQREGTP